MLHLVVHSSGLRFSDDEDDQPSLLLVALRASVVFLPFPDSVAQD